MKSWAILVRASSILLGIPCALARNWVNLPIIIWVINFLPFRVGRDLPHIFSACWILSIMGSHGVSLLLWFPIQAPSILIVLPSFGIFMWLSNGAWSPGLIFLVAITLSQWVFVLKGMISDLSMLNFALEAVHHLFRVSWIRSIWSSLLRYRFVSSAKRLVIILSSVPGMLILCILGLRRSSQASGLIARLNSAQDSRSPCQTP